MELPESYGAERNIALSDLTSFRVGGPACVVLHPRSYDAIADIVSAARRYSVPLALLGKGQMSLHPIAATTDGSSASIRRFTIRSIAGRT